MKLKPAPGRKVRLPENLRLLSENGEEITLTPWWHRLLATGDVVEVTGEPARSSLPARKETEE